MKEAGIPTNRWRWVAATVLATILILILASGLGIAGIQRGMLPPIQFTLSLGSMQLLTAVTDDAECMRPVRGSAGVSCSMSSIYHPNWYYIAWLERRGGTPIHPRPSYSKLFIIPLPDRPHAGVGSP